MEKEKSLVRMGLEERKKRERENVTYIENSPHFEVLVSSPVIVDFSASVRDCLCNKLDNVITSTSNCIRLLQK